MKTCVLLLSAALCALTALSSADVKKSKPSATVFPSNQFDSSSPASNTSTPKTTTSTPKPTTTTPKPTTTTAKPTTTTAKPTTNTTTAKPTTTTTKPTTTTTKPTTNTTTAKPTTTTTKPTTNTTTTKPTTTTTKPTTNTTTTKPTTTTLKPTTTTPKPTAPPGPTPPANLTVGNYTLKTKDNKAICLMAVVALQIRLQSPKANGTFIVQPDKTKVEGTCQDPKANLTLVFKEGYITFMFNKSAADKSVYVNAVSFSVSYPMNKGGNAPYTAKNNTVHLFPARVGHAYSCKRESVFMGNGLYLDVNQDRMQAFNLTKSNEFGSSDPCPADQPNYRVAIAVGVTLLVLIIIVVVAYLLSRKRRSDGYQSL